MANIYYEIESGFDYEFGAWEYQLPVAVRAEKITPPSHETLFSFLRHDLSELDTAMNELLSAFDVGTLNVNKDGIDGKKQKVYDTLRAAHPYYKYGGSADLELTDAVLFWVSKKLYDGGYGAENLVSKEKFFEITTPLCCRDFEDWGEEKRDEVYEKYTGFNNNDDLFELEKDGYTFQNVIDARENIQRMLFWIFDFSVPELSHLTIHQRAHLYYGLFQGDFFSVLEIEKKYSFGADERVCHSAIIDFDDEQIAIDVAQLHNNNYSINSDGNIAFPEAVNTLIADAQKLTGTPLREICVIDNLGQLLRFELVQMLDQNFLVKRCRYCGNYFIADNMKNEYCSGFAPNEKRPCSEIGSARTYRNKVKGDEISVLHSRAYKTHFARIKKGKMSQTEFSAWGLLAKQKMEEVRAGELSMEEYAAWLKI